MYKGWAMKSGPCTATLKYGMLNKHRIIYGVEVWGLGGARKKLTKFIGDFVSKFYAIIGR
jgi:hypothetical protein